MVHHVLSDLLLGVVGRHEDQDSGVEHVELHGDVSVGQGLSRAQDVFWRDELQPSGSVHSDKGVCQGHHAACLLNWLIQDEEHFFGEKLVVLGVRVVTLGDGVVNAHAEQIGLELKGLVLRDGTLLLAHLEYRIQASYWSLDRFGGH